MRQEPPGPEAGEDCEGAGAALIPVGSGHAASRACLS